MAKIGLPNIIIAFKTAGISAIQRGQRGIVALILKDSVHNGSNIYNDISEIPQDYSTYNKNQINLAFMGGVIPPSKVIVYVQDIESADYTEAQNYLETVKWDYLAVPGISALDATSMGIWIKGLRDNKDIKVKAVLPNTAGDHEGIINFTTDNITVNTDTYAAKDYCSRIAGILAGTPLNMSATFSVLTEVTDCTHLTQTEFNTAIGNGELVLMNDGQKVKIARAVNSLQTTTSSKGDSFKKIKIVDIIDQIHDDIKTTSNDNYVGKVPNTYDNKCLLITAIRGYFDGLITEQLIEENYSLDIDMEAQKNYIAANGVDISNLSDQALKEYNTGDNVFLGGSIKVIDAMEDISLNISM